MVEFSPREKYKEVKESETEDILKENTPSLEELQERETIEQKILNQGRENLEEQVEAEETPTAIPQTSYESFTQQGIYDLKETADLFTKQKEQEEKEKEERQRRALL